MSALSNSLAIVMAGGVGSRLFPLTSDRAKPAVPFGGPYRIIDFTLSNCLHSGLRKILILTQYKSHSMQEHLRDGWSIFNSELGEYITAVPPQMRTGDSWYDGTADAIYQNRYLIQGSNAKNVVVLSGDHIYRMDYSKMIQQHEESDADLTVACMEVDRREASNFGVVCVDQSNRICDFNEKPRQPATLPSNPDTSLVSMGVYVFSARMLCEELLTDHVIPGSTHDFGKDVIPRLIQSRRVYGHRFSDSCCSSSEPYWRDVGTIDSYYQANMDLLQFQPPFDLNCDHWRIRKYDTPAPPARIVCDQTGDGGVSNSILSNGVVVQGGEVRRSVLSPGVMIGEGASVRDSILFHNVEVGVDAVIRNCIIDKNVTIPDGETIGVNPTLDANRFQITSSGIAVVPKGYVFESDKISSGVSSESSKCHSHLGSPARAMAKAR